MKSHWDVMIVIYSSIWKKWDKIIAFITISLLQHLKLSQYAFPELQVDAVCNTNWNHLSNQSEN